MTSNPTTGNAPAFQEGDGPGARPAAAAPTSPMSMLAGFAPWLLFSVMTHREGASAAGWAAAVATALGVWLTIRQSRGRGLKIIDVTGVVMFSILTVAAFVGGARADDWIADFGRAVASFVLALVMLCSVFFMPFSEQYARESVPQEHWSSPQFRATNRKISLCWGVVVLVMALGHTVAGIVDPTSTPESGFRLVDLFFNWVLPVVLVLGAVWYTKTLANAARGRASNQGVRQ